MIAGAILRDNLEEDSIIAFLGDELEIVRVKKNDEMVEELEKRNPEVIAFDVGMEQSRDEFTEDEEELREEGHVFTPNSHQKRKVERLQSLEKHVKHRMEKFPEFIRFDPQITSKELAIDGEKALSSLGVEGEINGAEEFDAVLGAVTSRFYQEGSYKDLGVVVPEKLD